MIRILSALVLFFPAQLWAASLEKTDLFHAGFRMFIAMILVVALMLLVYVLNRKSIGFIRGKKADQIKILEMRHVGGKKTLCLVEVRGQEFFLGLGNERIDFLHHFGDSQTSTGFENELRQQTEGER